MSYDTVPPAPEENIVSVRGLNNALNLELKSAARVYPSDLSIKATVSQMRDKQATLNSEEYGQLTLSYSLPDDKLLLMEEQEVVTLERKSFEQSVVHNYAFTISRVEGGAILSSCKQSDQFRPVSVEVGGGIKVRQKSFEEGSVIQSTDYETYYAVPIEVEAARKIPMGTDPESPTQFTYNGQRFELTVLSSLYVQPSEEYSDSYEGGGYVLEFLLLQVR